MNNTNESKKRRKPYKSTVKHKSKKSICKKHSDKKETSKNKVKKNKSSSLKLCKTTFKDLLDNVAHDSSASTSTNSSKTKSNPNFVVKLSCYLCNLKFNTVLQLENHQTSCNSNKNFVRRKKQVSATKYSLHSEPSKLLDKNSLTTLSRNSTANKVNFPFLQSKDINSSNLSGDYRSDISIRKSSEKNKCIAKRKKVSSKKVSVLPGDKSSFESSKVNLQNNSDFSKEMVTIQQINNKFPQSSIKQEMLDTEYINTKIKTNINATKAQIHFVKNKNLETLESTLSAALSKIVKSERDIHVASKEQVIEECPKKMLFEELIYKCKKCGLICRSNIIFSNHQCQERLHHMTKCKVLLGSVSKLDFDSEKITYYQCKVCKKDFLERYLLKEHLKMCDPKERPESIKPMYLKIKKNDPPCPAPLIKQEPACDLPRDSAANFSTLFNQATSFDSHIPISHLQSTSQHSLRVPNIQQPPAPLYQFLQPVSNPNVNWKSIKEHIGCDCPAQNQGNNSSSEDCKPCETCLRKFAANLEPGGRYFDSMNSKFSESHEPNESLNSRDHQTLSFPTPPKTPDSIAFSSTPSLLTDFIATLQAVHIESFEAEFEEEEVAVNQNIPMEIDYTNLKFAWFDDSVIIDAFAFVNSEEDLEVLRYVCARCYDTLDKEDILDHCVQHGITNGANVSYVIRPSDFEN